MDGEIYSTAAATAMPRECFFIGSLAEQIQREQAARRPVRLQAGEARGTRQGWDNFWDTLIWQTPVFRLLKSGRLFRDIKDSQQLAGLCQLLPTHGVQGVAGSNPAVPTA